MSRRKLHLDAWLLGVCVTRLLLGSRRLGACTICRRALDTALLAYTDGRYRWYHGYWAPHIGFYGGINYGFGYVGRGYDGGYWNHDRFDYNRSVNNVNINVIRNVYNRRVNNFTNNRIGYDGGRGGLNVRPTASELAVLHEERIAPVQAQVQHREQAATDRSQFNAVNHGRPQMLATPHPLATEYRAPAAHPGAVPNARVLPSANARQQPAANPGFRESNRTQCSPRRAGQSHAAEP